jgi:hypothetical protein
MREQVARALSNKGLALDALGYSEKAIAVYDDLLTRFGSATEEPIREQVARTHYEKEVLLTKKIGGAPKTPIRNQIVEAASAVLAATVGPLLPRAIQSVWRAFRARSGH